MLPVPLPPSLPRAWPHLGMPYLCLPITGPPFPPSPVAEVGRRAPRSVAGPPGEKDGKITWSERYLGNVSSRGFVLSRRGTMWQDRRT